VPAAHAETLAAPGSPVRMGPEVCARAALLTCARYLPVGRSRQLLEALTAVDVSTGFWGVSVLHAGETPGRAPGALAYVHVACAE